MNIENDLYKSFAPIMCKNLIKGMAITVINDDYSFSISIGYADSTSEAKLIKENYFEIASITKTFVGILVSKMILDNRLSLDSKLSTYFSVPPVAKEVSILELLTHSSGLPRLPSNLKPANPMNPYLDYTFDDLIYELSLVEIGPKQYLYSNLGFAILGKILEKVYEDNFSNILQKEVLVPLGISEMSFSNGKDTIPLTSVYSSHFPNAEPWVLGEFEAAGGLRANIIQMQKYLMANLWPEKTTLKDAIGFSHKIFHQTDEFGVGMAWHKSNNSSVYFHEGGTYGSSSLIEFNPKNKTGIVILSNTYTSFDDFGPAIAGAYQILEK